jgi:hypothetical protein
LNDQSQVHRQVAVALDELATALHALHAQRSELNAAQAADESHVRVSMLRDEVESHVTAAIAAFREATRPRGSVTSPLR